MVDLSGVVEPSEEAEAVDINVRQRMSSQLAEPPLDRRQVK